MGKKQLLKGILAMMLILGITLLAGCTSTERLVMSRLYSITNQSSEDIRGTQNLSRLLIHKRSNMSFSEAVTIDYFTQGNEYLYAITVEYYGPHWRFMNEIILKIDDTLITLTNDAPTRVVIGSYVSERVTFILNNDIIEKSSEQIKWKILRL